MKVLELMHSLEEAYDRFGDIDVTIDATNIGNLGGIKEIIIESEEVILICEWL
jgi:hypothetical protein